MKSEVIRARHGLHCSLCRIVAETFLAVKISSTNQWEIFIQDPTDGGTVAVPFFRPYSDIFWGYSLKLRPKISWNGHFSQNLDAFPKIPRVTKKSKKP